MENVSGNHAPAILHHLEDNISGLPHNHIMIYYTSPVPSSDNESYLYIASYNLATGDKSSIETYTIPYKIDNEIIARNMQISETPNGPIVKKTQLVSVAGSENLLRIEIGHGENPLPDLTQLPSGSNPFPATQGKGSFLQMGRSTYLFYFDKDNKLSYFLMPNIPIKKKKG